MVVPAGNAPASSGYQPGALLLSYRTMADGVGIAPTQPGGSLGFRDRGITALPTIRNGQGGPAGAGRPPPSEGGRLLLTLHPEKLAARVGLAPTPCGLTNRRATLTPPGSWELALPAGFAPASVRLEDECLVDFGHGSILEMVSAAGFAPAIPRSQAECVGCY